MKEIFIPYGAYWSTPFSKWQSSFSELHSLQFSAHVASQELAKKSIDPSLFDFGVLGTSVPQKHAFYGLPWLMAEVGAPHVAGPTISQACATSARLLQTAVAEIQLDSASACLAIATDRTSNSPHIYYPSPSAQGGVGEHENWVLDNFFYDPHAKVSMLTTAENIARDYGYSMEMQNEVVLKRYEQYLDALKNDSAFQKKYMSLPFSTPDKNFRKELKLLGGDEGVVPVDLEKLKKLKPVLEGGSINYAGQTHPADGNAGMILTDGDKVDLFTQDKNITIKILGFASARVKKAYMPAATVPAAEKLLSKFHMRISDIKVIKTHNPFVVSDLYFSEKFNIKIGDFNNYGCSLIWGHPQSPTGLRSLIEMIEELVLLGGGYGLFSGCAAGDSAMAVLIKVGER